ncbi:U3 small nucleolar RNA-associated protein 11 [Rhizoclosmatium globosum]|uniref:U3 small nucleolar RNA-associated protein 11 n=1 Tax=Rhizoclosmatium globosum TaxID=329046 RepID=A0A1Y2A4W5_9FUNG|nr:U3 small nucleolar RNA-associated protein 11 [Rhizoclosmatium globosum]|eukprot:ORY17357.1 U3 small nucleolar RNA-associated protein 11 [Rhizoclosmatium globosum]
MKVASSLRKAAPRKAHRERSQLASRQHLGLLEKKKDYTLRATDFKEKQKKLKRMKEKAAFKNADEFYFGMINAKTDRGIHKKEAENRLKKFSAEEMALLRTQDKNYINYQRSVNLKKIERLQATKHIPEINEDEDVEEEEEVEEEETESKPSDPKKGKHTIFVESEKEVETFDPVEHFGTTPDMLKQKYNRLRAEQVAEKPRVVPGQGKLLKKLAKQRDQARRELKSREDREKKLRKVQMEMDLQRQIQNNKGAPPMKLGKDGRGLMVYKWKAERKR